MSLIVFSLTPTSTTISARMNAAFISNSSLVVGGITTNDWM